MKTMTIVLLSSLLFLACSIKTPEITLTGEKTALENQILGAYDQLTDNNLITTSRRTSATVQGNQQSQAVRLALQRQKFNKDEIDELKRSKVVGENNKGYLEILEHEKYKQDASFKKIVDDLVKQENHDRRIIYQRVLALNHRKDGERENITSIFAKMQYEDAAPGTKIQQQNGEWIDKVVKE